MSSCTKVALHRIALKCTPKQFGRSAVTNNLADLLYTRFEELARTSDLDDSLALYREAFQLRPPGHPDRAILQGNIANCLHARATLLGTQADLDEALSLYRSSLTLLPQDHPDRALSLAGIGSCLYVRFVQLGASSDFDEALSLYRDTLELRPPGHPDRVLSLVNIANCLHVRFSSRGVLSDLDEAIVFQREALELRSQGHPQRGRGLSSLAHYLRSRFTQLGSLSDLDEAIAFERDALGLLPKGDPDRALSLSEIANSLHTRFAQFGTLSDLNEALTLERETLQLRPQGHPERAVSLDNIARHLHARSARLREISDLDEALALQRSALELRPEDHPHRSTSLGNIADALYTRFKHLGVLSDLDEAIFLYRNALELFPQGDPRRVPSLIKVATCLHTRSTQFGTLSDIYEAITFAKDALELCPQGHPNRASSLAILAQCLHSLSKLSSEGDKKDPKEAFTVYSQLADISHATSLADLQSAKQWIEAAEECGHVTTVLAYQTFLRFSTHHLATLLSLPHDLAQLRKLTESTTADAFSACLRGRHTVTAVELLEQGRDVFWNLLFRLRSPLDEVMASGDAGKILADKFTQLSSLFRTVLDTPPNVDPRYDRASRLNTQLQDVVTDTRQLPGHARFLQPPRFSDLQIAATGGPVIIVNASQYGCDALIVLSDRDPIHVPLSITKPHASKLASKLHSLTVRAKSGDVPRDVFVLLRQLWDDIVFPIVKVLQECCPRGSRIWWCPTAEFARLPLHAAGAYREDQPTLSDLYISSYTPTLTALIRAQHPLDSSTEQHRFLLVGQVPELSTISPRIGSAATLICIQNEDANVARVGEQLGKNEFVHLACRGTTDRDHPFKSGIALGDGVLTVEYMMRHGSQNAQFGYLSGGHTITRDEESDDESIHLAAAIQFAGWRSVIGTMWGVDTAHTDEPVSRFYRGMVDVSGRLDHTRAALALHDAMRGICLGDIPIDQRILYIHIGA